MGSSCEEHCIREAVADYFRERFLAFAMYTHPRNEGVHIPPEMVLAIGDRYFGRK
jgi:hypothetical protein